MSGVVSERGGDMSGYRDGWCALVAAFVLLAASESGAQLADPPLGWDMWAPGWTQRESWRPERMDDGLSLRRDRHYAFIREGVPAAYRDAQNPLSGTPANIERGRALYTANCAGCHDPAGMGQGDAGSALYPSPALLAQLLRMPYAVDPYLLWAISEGGESFGTRMPAFKETLGEEQIWQIITFMRAGFPPEGAP
jgi:mono/diheme cytochrome c family protein